MPGQRADEEVGSGLIEGQGDRPRLARLEDRFDSATGTVRAMCDAEAARLACDSGTIFGRDVVPEVCSTIDTSSGAA